MLGALGKLGVVGNGISLPRRVRNILSKYDATLLMPGAGEPVLGPELVVNGGFDSDLSTWINEAGAYVWDNGLAKSVGVGDLLKDSGGVVGKTYKANFVITNAVGSGLYMSIAGNDVSYFSNGAHSRVVTCYALNKFIRVRAFSGSGGSIDNISVREILSYTNTYSSFVSGNYVESTGLTLTPVDGAVGLVVDAAGSVGPELWRSPVEGIGPGITSTSSNNGSDFTMEITSSTSANSATWKQYLPGTNIRAVSYSVSVSALSGNVSAVPRVLAYNGTTYLYVDSVTYTATTGVVSRVAFAPQGYWLVRLDLEAFPLAIGDTGAITFSNISVRELPGIHATQPTTQNKPALRNIDGFQYWQFSQSFHALNMTFPSGAGWDNATIITGRKTGAVTQTAQNVVGAHAITGIGDMYGRFYVPNGGNLSASELATLQRFMNLVAGVA